MVLTHIFDKIKLYKNPGQAYDTVLLRSQNDYHDHTT